MTSSLIYSYSLIQQLLASQVYHAGLNNIFNHKDVQYVKQCCGATSTAPGVIWVLLRRLLLRLLLYFNSPTPAPAPSILNNPT
jgi:hypothetical protein